MVALSTFTTLSVPPKTAFLMKKRAVPGSRFLQQSVELRLFRRIQAEAVFVVRRIVFGLPACSCPCVFTHIFSLVFDFGEKRPLRAVEGLCRAEAFLSDKDTTCSVRLNRESAFAGLPCDACRAWQAGEAHFSLRHGSRCKISPF